MEDISASTGNCLDKECRALLETQLKFRKHVLNTDKQKGLQNFTVGGIKLSTETLKHNLAEVITSNVSISEHAGPSNARYEPVDETILLSEKQKFQEKIRQLRSGPLPKRSKQAQLDTLKDININDPEDLVGKKVFHRFTAADGCEEWYTGVIL